MKKGAISLMAMSLSVGIVNAQELLNTIEAAHDGQVLSLSLSNDASQVLTGGADKRAYIWNVKGGSKNKAFGSHAANITAVAFSSNNKLFITVGADKRMIVYDAVLGKPKKILTGESPVTDAMFNPVNDNIASSFDNGNIAIYDAETKSISASMEGHSKQVNAISYSPDGKHLVSGSDDNTLKIWDASNGKLVNSADADVKGVTAVAYSPDGNFIAGGGGNNLVFMTDGNTGNMIADHSDHKGKINAVTFSPDVQFIASASDDGKIIIWDVQTRQTVKSFDAHTGGVTDLAFGNKGLILISAGRDGNIKTWDVEDLKIGKKKFTVGAQKPALACSTPELNDKNGNGLIEMEDKASLDFVINNEGKGVAYDVTVHIESDVSGIIFDSEIFVGNLPGGKKQNISVPLYAQEEMESVAGKFTVEVTEANNFNPDPLSVPFQTKGAERYTYVLVSDFKYSSGTGKAETGAPITLKLRLQNPSEEPAENVKVVFRFPENVLAVDKLSESIELLSPGETKEVSVEFYANESYTGKAIDVVVDIQGATYTNLKDVDLAVTMNEELPVSTLAIAAAASPMDQPMYRGSGDPLKGLNVARSTQLAIGKYYALIIGIDEYSGAWNPLVNAVNDARAVENLLKAKYRFDSFRKLYNGEATREAIINQMEWFVSNVRPEDNLFIYYSGHGEYRQELNKGYWVPVDANTSSTSKYISNSDIQTFLGGIRSKHTLLVSDACFSGDIFRGSTVMVPFEDSEKYYKEVHQLPSRKAITSGGIEPVMDGGRDGHSVFAYYFLKVLDNNNHKYMDAGQLYDKLKVPVTNNSDQSPKFSPIKNSGDEGGQFVFIKK
jgi:hypothetical protein